MTKEPGTTATPAPDRTDPAPTTGEPVQPPAPAPGAVVLALLAVGWLAAMLWSARAGISFSGVESVAITSTAYALPGVISASLLCGAAVSLTLTNLLGRRGVGGATPRFATALAGGLLTGVLAAVAVSVSYGEGQAIMVLAGTTAAAATVGGIAGGLRNTLLVGAVITAGLAVFAVGFALSYYQEPVLALYGSGETEASQLTAFVWFSRTASAASGLAAGGLAFGYLRRAGRRIANRTGQPVPLRWPAYLIAGGGPGVLLLVTELLTRTAGARVLRMAGALSEADRAAHSLLGDFRFTHAMWVLFLGALTATIAFGFTLRPPTQPASEAPERSPAAPGSGPASSTESDPDGLRDSGPGSRADSADDGGTDRAEAVADAHQPAGGDDTADDVGADVESGAGESGGSPASAAAKPERRVAGAGR